MASHFPAAAHLRRRSDHKAWITDTFTEVNGVCRTIQILAHRQADRAESVVLTSMDKTQERSTERGRRQRAAPDGAQGRPEELPAGGHFSVARIRIADLAFPPFLEIIEYIDGTASTS